MGTSSQDPRTDRELVLAFQSGEQVAYEAIYARHYERVHRTCMRVLGNPADASEATQEAFLRGFRGMARFNGRYQLGAWLARIASNVSVDTLRSRQRSVNVVATTDEMGDIEQSAKGTETEIEERVTIARALEDMSPLHAEALLLRAVEGLSHQEMADRLEMTPTQVKSLLHRSRSSFKKAWENVSGWAGAPLAWFRPWRTKNAPAESVAATSPATVAILERVATAATAAVIAVAGFGGGTTSFQHAPDVATPRYVAVPSKVGRDNPRAARAAVAEAAATAPIASTTTDDVRLVERIFGVQKVLPEDFEGGGNSGGGSGGIPNPNNKKPIERRVQNLVDDVNDKLEGGTPIEVAAPLG